MPPGEAYCALSTAICCRDDGDRRPETTASALLTPLLATARSVAVHVPGAAVEPGHRVASPVGRRGNRLGLHLDLLLQRHLGAGVELVLREAIPVVRHGRSVASGMHEGKLARTRPLARRRVLLARLQNVIVCPAVTPHSGTSRGPAMPSRSVADGALW